MGEFRIQIQIVEKNYVLPVDTGQMKREEWESIMSQDYTRCSTRSLPTDKGEIADISFLLPKTLSVVNRLWNLACFISQITRHPPAAMPTVSCESHQGN